MFPPPNHKSPFFIKPLTLSAWRNQSPPVCRVSGGKVLNYNAHKTDFLPVMQIKLVWILIWEREEMMESKIKMSRKGRKAERGMEGERSGGGGTRGGEEAEGRRTGRRKEKKGGKEKTARRESKRRGRREQRDAGESEGGEILSSAGLKA